MKSKENVFPMMKKYGIPLEERRVHKGLLKELLNMSKKVDKSTTLYADVGDNKESAFVFIPTSKGYKRLKKNENKHKWFSHLLTALGGDGFGHPGNYFIIRHFAATSESDSYHSKYTYCISRAHF